MTIIRYFQSDRQSHWLAEIEKTEWRAAKFLAELLQTGRFHDALGPGALYLLTEGDALVSFLTLSQKDCINAPDCFPWIGFVHTNPAYRGQRCAGRLLDHACEVAAKHGAPRVYICTDHEGLYEKYGFTYLEDRLSIYGEMSRVYMREVRFAVDFRPLTADDIRDDRFHDFVRHQRVTECWRRIDGEWKIVPAEYTICWAPDTLVQRAAYVREVLQSGGWCIAAMRGESLIGMALLGRRLGSRGQYIDLDSFHVSAPWRNRGIGKRLFSLACDEARRRGAEKLYISAHSAKETIAAYFALGCTHAAEIDPKHAADELCDMPLEFDLLRGAADYTVQTGTLDAATFTRLCTVVGWEVPGEKQVAHALKNSLATFLVLDGFRPIAMARLLGDLAMSCYVKDFAVQPEYQGRGVGRKLMQAIESYIRQNRQDGWHMSLELISAKGKEGFYRKLGFEERPSDNDGAGMFKMIRE